MGISGSGVLSRWGFAPQPNITSCWKVSQPGNARIWVGPPHPHLPFSVDRLGHASTYGFLFGWWLSASYISHLPYNQWNEIPSLPGSPKPHLSSSSKYLILPQPSILRAVPAIILLLKERCLKDKGEYWTNI